MEAILKPTLHAPELDGGLAWFNTRRPLSMKELRGCVVLLDFWTYCCINCMHVLPVLRALEERFAGAPVVVIGVHSGKFSAEQDPARIREAIGRYDVAHPVVVDDQMAIWSRFAVRSWPTLVVVRPDGTIAAVAPGEPDLETLVAFVQREIDHAKGKGTLADGPPDVLAPAADEHEPLRYPGKVIALPDGRLVVSDSGHHRVLVTSPSGEVLHTVGSGLRGLADGPFDGAAFDDPQGATAIGEVIYLADARNHALRRIDLERGVVTTVAGTGELGLTPPAGRVIGRDVALRSPWDVLATGGVIYVAMAGSHQIWRFYPDDGTIDVYAGTGVEALIDGPVARSAWAQPSGMSERGGELYIADSETSALRVVDLARGEVETLIGEGLFDFGDEDGDADQAMLQHPLDVAALADGSLLVADTYNGKLKRVEGEGAGARVRTVLGGLHEPGAVTALPGGAWLVADTNAHRLLRVEAGEARELVITGAPPARTGTVERRRTARPPAAVDGWFTSLLELPPGEGLSPGGAVVRLVLGASAGTELSASAPVCVQAEVSRRSDLLILKQPVSSFDGAGGRELAIDLAVEVTALPDAVVEAEMVVSVDYLACGSKDQSACWPRNVRVRVPVRLLAEGGRAGLSFGVPLPALGE
jgi:thiol-disulfide isomerase/thioredoxin